LPGSVARNRESLSQELQQRLQQRLNPQNVALGRVLEMSEPEFEDEVRRELDDNPALEVLSPTTPADNEFTETSDQLQLADYGDADDVPVYLRRAANASPDDVHYDAGSFAADDNRSMGEILMERLANDGELSEKERIPAAYIIGNIDDNGYMTRSLPAIADDIAMTEGIYIEPSALQSIFDKIRSLDPAGIGATDLRDCLLLQLDRRKPSKAVGNARNIIADNFELFSKKHYDRLAAQVHLSREEMENALQLIKTLNPKPGQALESASSADRIHHVSPDFMLDYDAETDTFSVSLLGSIPELGIEESFRAEAEEAPLLRESSAAIFIRRQRRSATDFIKLVEQRSATLMAIVKAIVKLQHDFFISGDRSSIRPMVLRDVAAQTGLDLSVISRATATKYILTSHGVYPLKMLFNESPDGDLDVSSHRILAALGEIISSEDKRAPLSDRALCDALQKRGLNIARRTVAKYRERLGLPVARLRRTF